MGQARYFHPQHQELVKEAAVIAEEMTFDFFKLHRSQWQRVRYDILTLEGLRQEEISSHAHALVAKYKGCPPNSSLRSAWFDFYRVCLQDHNILKTLESCPDLSFFPLLIYIITHELVHVIRFSQFLALFEASEAEKAREESQVHRLTGQILQPLNYLDLPPVIRYYQ